MKTFLKESVLVLLSVSFIPVYASLQSRKLPEITETVTELILDTGGFDIYINYELWLHSRGEVYIRANDQVYSNAHHPPSLVLQNITKVEKLKDCGFEKKHIFYYGDVYGKLMMEASMSLCAGLITFEQKFPNELNGTSSGNADHLVSGFPTFEAGNAHSTSRGYAHFVSWFYEDAEQPYPRDPNLRKIMTSEAKDRRRLLVAPGFTTPRMGAWSNELLLTGGIGGTGVLSIFDKDSGDSLVISAFENPMTVSAHSPKKGSVHYGLMGNTTSIPAGFKMSIVAHVGKGVNDAFQHWGLALRKHFNKQSLQVSRSVDISLQYLGYTTDNGAYYYYNTEPSEDYGTTLINVKNYADEQDLPYKYILLDSWWYYRGDNGGVSEWTAREDVFPEGIENLYEETGWLVQAHNRYWAYENVYASQNGGEYDFIEDENLPKGAVPIGSNFWDNLLSDGALNWGLRIYEQDWLYNEFYTYVSDMLKDVNLGRNWLLEMGQGAASNGLTIQYCMPYIRHLIQSLEVPQTTQARASDDYVVAPYDDPEVYDKHPNWNIGAQSMMISALGLAPSKDGFWTTSSQPGNPYGDEKYEPCPRIHAAVASLSTGPVQIADGIGYTDANLVMMTCMKNGRLLNPSLPATPIDSYFYQSALGDELDNGADDIGPSGQVWFAPSVIGLSGGNKSAPWREIWQDKYGIQVNGYGSIFVAQLERSYSMLPSDLGCYLFGKFNVQRERKCYNNLHSYYIRELNSSFTDANAVQKWNKDTPLELNPNGIYDFSLYSVSEIDEESGWSFLGEADKFVSHSPNRFLSVVVSHDGTEMRVIATSGENERNNFFDSSLKSNVKKIRDMESIEFMNDVDDTETITVGFMDPKGQVRTVTCEIPGGKRGSSRYVMIIQDYDQGYCQY